MHVPGHPVQPPALSGGYWESIGKCGGKDIHHQKLHAGCTAKTFGNCSV